MHVKAGTKFALGTNPIDMPAGARCDLPLGIALSLAKRDIVDLKNPDYLTSKFFDSLRADSTCINFKEKSSYLYENVLKITE